MLNVILHTNTYCIWTHIGEQLIVSVNLQKALFKYTLNSYNAIRTMHFNYAHTGKRAGIA